MKSKLNKNQLIPIPIQHHSYSNCIQDVFVTYLSWKNEAYEKLFDHTWSFSYKEKTCFGIDIYKGDFTRIYETLKQNFGISFVNTELWKSTELQSELLAGEPIVACVDTFYCYWHKSHQKYHNEHYVIINGFDEKSFYCIDPYTSKNIEKINVMDFKNIILDTFVFRTIDYRETDWTKNVVSHIADMLAEDDHKNDFHQMSDFANDFWNETERFKMEIDSYDNIIFWPFLLKLNNIGYGRKCYSIFLAWLITHKGYKMDEYVSLLNEYSNEWSTVCSMFIKYKRTDYSESVKSRIYDKILNLSESEASLAARFLDQMQDKMKK